jgi:tRNA(Ile)-lysidine synthase
VTRAVAGESAGPLGAAEFSSLMDDQAPFESRPHLAAAVSGGADSMAMALLLDTWVRARRGTLSVLTVDHRLRPESGAEARAVGRTLKAHGIGQRILTWKGDVPAANLQAEARRIRYDLLEDWCARHGVLHLVLAHHREDQAETFLLRLGRGSGLDGLAAMPAIQERAALRLLRPLLPVPKACLQATLRARGIDWIDDPSNRDTRHARVRMRKLAPDLAAEGLDSARLAATARSLGRARAALEETLAAFLLTSVSLRPEGYAILSPSAFAQAPEEIALRGLARVLGVVGGGAYAPRLESLEHLLARLREGVREGLPRAATLGGCRILPRGGKRPHILVARERRGLPVLPLASGRTLRWDGRFDLTLSRKSSSSELKVGPLGAHRIAADSPIRTLAGAIPAAATAGLPAVSDAKGLLVVPQLAYQRPGTNALSVVKCRFAPQNSLSPATFTVV